MKGAMLTFKTDGTVEVQGLGGLPGEEVAKEFAWLLDSLGKVELVGHKPHAHAEETTQIRAGR